jgi:hypothetical protein
MQKRNKLILNAPPSHEKLGKGKEEGRPRKKKDDNERRKKEEKERIW